MEERLKTAIFAI